MFVKSDYSDKPMTGQGHRGFVQQPLEFNDYNLPIQTNNTFVVASAKPKTINSFKHAPLIYKNQMQLQYFKKGRKTEYIVRTSTLADQLQTPCLVKQTWAKPTVVDYSRTQLYLG